MAHGFPEPNNVGLNSDYGCSGRCETVSDRYKRCSFQNVIQHIDIYGSFKSNFVERYNRDGGDGCKSMITASCYRRLNCPRSSSLEEKLSKLSVTTRVSSLYPGHDKRKRLKSLQKMLIG